MANLPPMWLCGDSKAQLVAYDSAAGTTNVQWAWDSRSAPDLPDERRPWFNDLDDVKPVSWNGVPCVLITASYRGGVVLLRRSDQALLFSLPVVNAHSADLSPGGWIAIAGSIGTDQLVLHEVAAGVRAEGARSSFPLHHGHGAVYQPATGLLWTCGGSVVRVYRWTDGSCVHDRDLTLPGPEAHDLMPDPGTGDLIVTTETGVWRLNLASETFTPFAPLHDTMNVKGVSIEAGSGMLAYTMWDQSVHLVALDGGRQELKFPGWQIYKVRWDQPCQLLERLSRS
ncbi:MAG: hypothetical protein H0V44_05015 [Planctomycetes bacterium]|nr:hypothetical protein [Planctomycetota bacterium]